MNTRKILRSLIEAYIAEGGLKLPPDQRKDLTPSVVRDAAEIYRSFMKGFNLWLEALGESPVEPVRPTGSSVHAEKDIVDRPDAVYGDIDYLVSFPVEYSSDDVGVMRKEEAAASKKYLEYLEEYIRSVRPDQIDIDLTLKSSPEMLIVKVPDVGLVQVDTVVTHPPYTEWMKGRYSPERGIKGYITGNLYKALGDYLVVSIGTEGVIARLKDGQRVPSKFRSGITYKSISTNFRTFFRDIADYIIMGEYTPDALLESHPGLDPDNVNLDDMSYGILGLARTLSSAGEVDLNEMLTSVYNGFVRGMDENVSKKVARDITPAQEKKLRNLSAQQAERVKSILGV